MSSVSFLDVTIDSLMNILKKSKVNRCNVLLHCNGSDIRVHNKDDKSFGTDTRRLEKFDDSIKDWFLNSNISVDQSSYTIQIQAERKGKRLAIDMIDN